MATEATLACRAAAVLTNAEVDGAVLDLRNALDGEVTIECDFTVDTLTNCTLRVYAGSATPPTTPLHLNGVVQTYLLTGDSTPSFVVKAHGARYLMVSAEGIGACGASSLTMDYYYLNTLATSLVDGQQQIN